MKRILLCFSASSLIFSGAIAQSNAGEVQAKPAEPTVEGPTEAKLTPATKKSGAVSSAAPFWTEDFSGGIPSSWTNQGYSGSSLNPDPLAIWEYRGPNTSPDNTVGSRGAFNGNRGPIASPTASNGFIIFDSDWLDNGGQTLSNGAPDPSGGTSNTPHIGTLTTDTIDCSGAGTVEIAMHTYMRHFSSRYLVAVSNDGGATFSDTVRFLQNVGVNSATSNAIEITANISAVAANESNVVLSFIYDGSKQLPGAGGLGYYFWQIDDIELRELPKYSIKFVEWTGGHSSSAPAHDVVPPDGFAKYGHVNLQQAAPYNFDSNIFNYGSADLNNVRLRVEIQDAATNSTVSTLHSDPTTFLASQDSLGWDSLSTSSSWTPSAVGSYNIIYSIESDSIPAAPGSYTPMDTFTLQVTDETTMNGEYSMSWGSIDNYVGTDNLASGQIISIGERFNFPNPSKDTSGFVFIEGMTVPLSSATDTAGVIIWEVYDTTGFEFGSSGGPTGSPLYDWTFQLNTSMPGTEHFFNFSDTLANGDVMPFALPSGEAYFFLMTFIPASPDGVVRIGNNQDFAQPSGAVIVQSDAGNWFGRFGNSDNLNSPILRLNMAETPPYDIGLKAYQMRNAVSVYPNPSSGKKINIEVSQGGTYNLEVVNLLGQTMHSEEITVSGNDKLIRDFSHFSTGVYLMNISNENFTNTQKLTIE